MTLKAGIDEVGRGPLAGPVVAACVLFPDGFANSDIQDSKKLSKKKREKIVETIHAECLDWSIACVGPEVIDRVNIRNASIYAMRLSASTIQADHFLVDGDLDLGHDLPHTSIIGGDAKICSISAASILAKVWRDTLMAQFDKVLPEYGFSRNAGYPTQSHVAALRTHGTSSLHRRSFGPVARCSKNRKTPPRQETELSFASKAFLLHKARLKDPLAWLDR